MSTVELRLQHCPAAPARQGHRIGGLLRAVRATLHEWRRRMRDREALARFDERLLKDIGLTPAEAQFLVNKPFWRA